MDSKIWMVALLPTLAVAVGSADARPGMGNRRSRMSGAQAQGNPQSAEELQQRFQISPEQQEQLQGRTGQAAAQAVDPAYATTPLNVTVPTETPLMIRMVDGVTSDTPADRPFSAKLETDLKVGQTLVAPAGSLVYGKVVKSRRSRRLVGRAKIQLTLTSLTVKKVLYPMKTGDYKEAGESAGVKTAGAAAAGAAIGGMSTDSDIESEQEENAKTGAAVGVGVSALKEEDDLAVNPGDLLQFSLSAPLVIDETK